MTIFRIFNIFFEKNVFIFTLIQLHNQRKGFIIKELSFNFFGIIVVDLPQK